MTRLVSGVTLSLLLLGGLGCSNKGIVLPTDEEARRRAEPQPPPPVSFGAPPGAPTSPEPPGVPNKVQLKGLPTDQNK